MAGERGSTKEPAQTVATSGGVPKALARPPMKGMPFVGPGGIGVAREADAAVAANAEMSERAAEFRRCPQCASGHYKQRSVRT